MRNPRLPDGTRASVLADRARLSRQAITQLTDELEERGVVVRLPDPADGRAKIIQYTPEALKIFDASRRTIAALSGAGPASSARASTPPYAPDSNNSCASDNTQHASDRT